MIVLLVMSVAWVLSLALAVVLFLSREQSIRQGYMDKLAKTGPPPPTTQAGAANFYYKVAQGETRLLERIIMDDQQIPIFHDDYERATAKQLVDAFYGDGPPAVTPAQPQVAQLTTSDGIAPLRTAAHLRRMLEASSYNDRWPGTVDQ